jgi:hypothetical protein
MQHRAAAAAMPLAAPLAASNAARLQQPWVV